MANHKHNDKTPIVCDERTFELSVCARLVFFAMNALTVLSEFHDEEICVKSSRLLIGRSARCKK